jgi:hypothetical protein
VLPLSRIAGEGGERSEAGEGLALLMSAAWFRVLFSGDVLTISYIYPVRAKRSAGMAFDLRSHFRQLQ